MTPELKAKWVAALRSGTYKQGQDFLARNDKYCCLGVLAEVSEELSPHFLFDGFDSKALCGDATFINNSMRGKIDLDFRTADNLASMNDSGMSFSEIADWIEANL